MNFNPQTMRELARTVYAPANEALRQAIELKRQKRIDWLVAGPVNAFHPAECEGIVRSAEIDRLIVASSWVIDIYRDHAPELVEKIRVCPCGVDAEWWAPSTGTDRAAGRRAVVYWKSGGESFCRDVEAAMSRRGLQAVRVRYGHYQPGEFKSLLNESALAIFLSSFETQGLALAESWSMNVPTLVWNPCEMTEWRGYPFRARSSAPYLTSSTGLAWRTIEELERSLDEALQRQTFNPRSWVLANMTDARCARRLFDVIVHDRVESAA
jgi:hypothetical protein